MRDPASDPANEPAARVVIDLVGGHVRIRHLVTSRYLSPRLIATDGPRAKVALVGNCATLLAGDHLRLEVEVAPGAHLELIEPSGMVAYNARGGSARWSASIRVGSGGTLLWPAAPFVVAGGADVHRGTEVDLAPDGVVMLRETLVLGRSGETGGAIRSQMWACHDGRPLLVEDLDLRQATGRAAPGVLGSARVLATIALLGASPETIEATHETRLAGAGALRRELTEHAHLADQLMPDTWRRWSSQVMSR